MLMRQRCLLGYAVYHEYGYHWYQERPTQAQTADENIIDYEKLCEMWDDEMGEWSGE